MTTKTDMTRADTAKLFLKGMAMGAADVVPGVSGGTVAFISGIYERLINALKSINIAAIRILFKDGIGAAWSAIDGTFLLVLFAGIMTSILSLAKLISYWLTNHPVLVWSFFFGLILASVIYIVRQMKQPSISHVTGFLVGVAFAYWITVAEPLAIDPTHSNIFFAGMIAICAMILPGISGSFILLLMGLYTHVIGAIKQLDIITLAIFASGCMIGLLSFSRVLSWLLTKYHDLTLAVLAGVMLGSLNKVWPWKQTLSYRTNSHGEQVPFMQDNVLPAQYEYLVGADSMMLYAIGLMLVGFLVVLGLEGVNVFKNKTADSL